MRATGRRVRVPCPVRAFIDYNLESVLILLRPLPDVLRGISSPSDAAAARQLEESLQRRPADQQLRDELAVHDFSGPKYQRFEEELARYGTSVLRVAVFGPQATYVAAWVAKGTRVVVTGTVAERSWDDNGSKRSRMEITASEVAISLLFGSR